MIQPATRPLVAHRHAPFVYTTQIEDVDLAGATLKMQVRQNFGTPGDPEIDLSGAGAGSQGLSIAVEGGDSFLTIQIDEATLEGQPEPGVLGDDLEWVYDIAITPSGGIKSLYFRGPFTIRSGSTV